LNIFDLPIFLWNIWRLYFWRIFYLICWLWLLITNIWLLLLIQRGGHLQKTIRAYCCILKSFDSISSLVYRAILICYWLIIILSWLIRVKKCMDVIFNIRFGIEIGFFKYSKVYKIFSLRYLSMWMHQWYLIWNSNRSVVNIRNYLLSIFRRYLIWKRFLLI